MPSPELGAAAPSPGERTDPKSSISLYKNILTDPGIPVARLDRISDDGQSKRHPSANLQADVI
jgi:hypothetical protein